MSKAKRIYKYTLAVEGVQPLYVPAGFRPLCVQVQYGVPCLWAEVDDTDERIQVDVFTYGTGHPLAEDRGAYVGSYQLEGGAFCGHVYVTTEAPER